jgi:hypothetical protein
MSDEFYVDSSAAGDSKGHVLFTMPQGSMAVRRCVLCVERVLNLLFCSGECTYSRIESFRRNSIVKHSVHQLRCILCLPRSGQAEINSAAHSPVYFAKLNQIFQILGSRKREIRVVCRDAAAGRIRRRPSSSPTIVVARLVYGRFHVDWPDAPHRPDLRGSTRSWTSAVDRRTVRCTEETLQGRKSSGHRLARPLRPGRHCCCRRRCGRQSVSRLVCAKQRPTERQCVALGHRSVDTFFLFFWRRSILKTCTQESYTFAPSKSPPILAPQGIIITNVVPGDFNYDGRLDLLFMGQHDPDSSSDKELIMSVWIGQGNGVFSTFLFCQDYSPA